MRITRPTFPGWLACTLVVLVALVTRLPAWSSWWCLDDWGQLARAADHLPGTPLPTARWLSQHLYWKLAWPVFQLNPLPYTLSRIFLHAAAAVAVFRLAAGLRRSVTAGWMAGLLFAASPMAFTVVVWASGVQELLAAALALWAAERWFTCRGNQLVLPVALAVGSLLAKESALGLPLLLAAGLAWDRRHRRPVPAARLAGVGFLLLMAAATAYLVSRQFATGPGDPYQTGGPLVVAGNLGKFGWWLLSQGPVFTGQVTWPLAAVGLGFLTLWLLGSIFALTRGNVVPLACLLAALLSLAPATVLVNQARPYLAYVAMACLAVALGCLVPGRWQPRPAWLLIPTGAAAVWGFWAMDLRLERVDSAGLPADPVVRAMALSRETCRTLTEGRHRESPDLVVFQMPLRAADVDRAAGFPSDQVQPTARHSALGGEMGLSLLAGRPGGGHWVNSIVGVPGQALVFCETAQELEAWGPTRDALLYATLLDVFVGNKARARVQLRRAEELDPDFSGFRFDPDLLKIPSVPFRSRARSFLGDPESAADAEVFRKLLDQVKTW